MSSCKFQSGQEVRLKSERDQLGVIMGESQILNGECWYRVNFGGGVIKTEPEENLELYEAGRTIIDLLIHGVYGNRETLSKLITFTKLCFPLKKNVYSFKASRTELHEYQFKPVLKFIDSQDHRLLIADEVGLGKTIEAGYILQEQRARYDMDRVLVICPAALVGKWQIEMESKFQEDFEILKSSDVRDFLRKIRDRGDEVKLRGICSLQTLRSKALMEDWEAVSPPLDMVIIDEGHHLRNPETRNHRMGLIISETSDAMLMLTATPVHLGNQDLFYLLRILSTDEFDNFAIFQTRVQTNSFILTALRHLRKVPLKLQTVKDSLKQCLEGEGAQWFAKNPFYDDVLRRIDAIDINNREQVIELQRDVNRLNLLSHILTRTRKRDVQIKAKRVARIIRPDFTDVEMAFYQAVTNFIILQYSQKGLGVFGAFIAIMPQRQVASCIPAMIEHYAEKLIGVTSGGLDEEMSDVIIEDIDEGLPEPDTVTTSAYQTLADLIKGQSLKGVDSKFDALLGTLRDLDKEEPGRQVIIFSYFKKTLEYLSWKLHSAGYKNVVISGQYPGEERNRIIDQFRDDKSIRIMLSSEVGSEGLDFQFCHILVNYDLPWNPMVVEQRIGRLDRFGQTSERILIYNFSIPGTIEDRILRRLYNRIRIFEESLGDLETILGEEIKQLTHDLLTSKLTPEEQEERIAHSADIIIRKKQEQAELEAQSAKFIGHDEFFNDEIERIKRYKRFISSEELLIFVREFLEKHFQRCTLKQAKKMDGLTLTVNEDFITFMRRHLPTGDLGFKQFVRKTTRDTISVIFDGEEAFRHPGLQFINIVHPIVRAIASYYEKNKEELHPVARIALDSQNHLPGEYFYFVYLLEMGGARSYRALESIFIPLKNGVPLDEDSSEDLLNEVITLGKTLQLVPVVEEQRIKELVQKAQDEFGKRIDRRVEEIKKLNELLINSRLTTLEQSFNVKYQKKQELLRKAQEKESAPQYIRMLEGGLRNLKLAYETKKEELEKAKNIYKNFDPVGAGFLVINHA